MAKTITLGWFTNSETAWNELLYQIPEPLNIHKCDAQYSRCPATAHYSKNTFVFRAGFDLELRYDAPTKKIKYVDGSLDPHFVKEMVVQFHPDEWRNHKTPIFQVQVENGIVADEPVWMEVSPAFGPGVRPIPGFMIPGTFDIYSWQRMFSYGIEWTNTDQNFVMRRGDPLMHLRFRSKDPADNFKLKEIKMDDQLKHDVEKCQGVKFALKNYSWRLMPLNRKIRPRRYIK